MAFTNVFTFSCLLSILRVAIISPVKVVVLASKVTVVLAGPLTVISWPGPSKGTIAPVALLVTI